MRLTQSIHQIGLPLSGRVPNEPRSRLPRFGARAPNEPKRGSGGRSPGFASSDLVHVGRGRAVDPEGSPPVS